MNNRHAYVKVERRAAARPLVVPRLLSTQTRSLRLPPRLSQHSRSLNPPSPHPPSLRSATRARCSGTTPTGTGWRASRSTSATPPASSPPPTARCDPRILRWRGRCSSMNRSRRAGAHTPHAALPVVLPAAALRVAPIPHPAPPRASQVGRSPQLRCLPATDEAKRAWQGEKDAMRRRWRPRRPRSTSSALPRAARPATRARHGLGSTRAHATRLRTGDRSTRTMRTRSGCCGSTGHGLWVVSLRAATPNQAQGALLARDSAVVPTKIASEWAMISDGPIPQFVDSPTIQCMTPERAAIYYKVHMAAAPAPARPFAPTPLPASTSSAAVSPPLSLPPSQLESYRWWQSSQVLLVVGCVTLAGIWGYGQYQSRTKKNKLKAMTAHWGASAMLLAHKFIDGEGGSASQFLKELNQARNSDMARAAAGGGSRKQRREAAKLEQKVHERGRRRRRRVCGGARVWRERAPRVAPSTLTLSHSHPSPPIPHPPSPIATGGADPPEDRSQRPRRPPPRRSARGAQQAQSGRFLPKDQPERRRAAPGDHERPHRRRRRRQRRGGRRGAGGGGGGAPAAVGGAGAPERGRVPGGSRTGAGGALVRAPKRRRWRRRRRRRRRPRRASLSPR